MHHKLTITVDEQVYNGLHSIIGRGNISRFLEELARARLFQPDCDAEVCAMAADVQREAEANEWSEALIGDGYSETR